MAIVYLNGHFVSDDQAFISVLDRGFMFGDGVYEVIPAYWGKLFRLEQHLQRLDASLHGIRMDNPLTHARWREILEGLVQRNAASDEASVYLQITRGPAQREHAIPKQIQPTVFAMCHSIPPVATALAQRGVSAIVVPDVRWEYCHIKSIALLPNVLMRQQAVDAGAAEAILIRDGYAVEGTASNLFIVKDGILVTPPKGPYLLPGITRDLILELAQAHGIAQREAPIPEADLARAGEIWLTSSTKEILPVTRLNNAVVGDGNPGALWERMIGLYQDYKRGLRAPEVS